jgi:hypothetical protein
MAQTPLQILICLNHAIFYGLDRDGPTRMHTVTVRRSVCFELPLLKGIRQAANWTQAPNRSKGPAGGASRTLEQRGRGSRMAGVPLVVHRDSEQAGAAEGGAARVGLRSVAHRAGTE